MARTTLDIDDPVLARVRALRDQQGRSMGAIVSQLLAEALAARKGGAEPPPFSWRTQPMAARVDLLDKDAVYALLDRDG